MTTGWLVVLLVGAATIAIKATGPLLLGGRELPERLLGVVSLLAPALLAALVATLTLESGKALVIDARADESFPRRTASASNGSISMIRL